MTFIKHSSSYLNIDQAATAEIKPGQNGAYALKFRDAAGRELATVSGAQELDVERLTSPLVGASGPPTLAVFIRVEQTDHRPTADDVQVQTAAIVAWRVTRNGAESVFLGPAPAGEMFLALPAAKLLEVATGRIHDGIDGAKQALLHAAQQRYDSEHPAEAEVVEMPKPVGGRRAR